MIQIVTTPYIEDAKTIQYKGVVTANEVIGVNVISDTIASFSDFFGGMSGEYRSKLDGLKDVVMRMIEKEAKRRGANAVIGFNMNFNEISGKGKQMFMASAVGTAVVVDYKNKNDNFEIESSNSISLAEEDMQYLLLADKGIEEMKEVQQLSPDCKEAITTVAKKEWLSTIVQYYIDVKKAADNRFNNPDGPSFVYSFNEDFIISYMGKQQEEDVADFLYSKLTTENKKYILELVEKAGVISYKHLFNNMQILKVEEITNILSIKKRKYNFVDVEYMQKISDHLHNLPVLAKEGEFKSGMFGKKEIKLLCVCGNPLNDNGVCSYCGCDQYGMSKYQRESIDNLDRIIKIMKSMQ